MLGQADFDHILKLLTDARDPFSIFGVLEEPKLDSLKQAKNRLVRQFHPDIQQHHLRPVANTVLRLLFEWNDKAARQIRLNTYGSAYYSKPQPEVSWTVGAEHIKVTIPKHRDDDKFTKVMPKSSAARVAANINPAPDLFDSKGRAILKRVKPGHYLSADDQYELLYIEESREWWIFSTKLHDLGDTLQYGPFTHASKARDRLTRVLRWMTQ